jgi:hypothetical protein
MLARSIRNTAAALTVAALSASTPLHLRWLVTAGVITAVGGTRLGTSWTGTGAAERPNANRFLSPECLRTAPVCLNFSNCRVLGIESQRLVPVSMPNQSINRISDDGTHVTMERRVFRFGRLLSDRLQAVTFVKTHT